MAWRARRSPDPYLPEVAHAHRHEHPQATFEKDLHRADVALGAVRLASVDRELLAQRVERVRAERERAPSEDERVDPVRELELYARAAKFGAQEH